MTSPTAVSQDRANGLSTTAFSPALVIEVELSEPLPALRCPGYGRLWVLGRLLTEPVGTCILPLGDDGTLPGQLGTLLWPELRGQVGARFLAAGLPEPQALTDEGLAVDPTAWPFLRRRSDVLARAPFISVVVCTHGEHGRLERCLECLERQEYPSFEIVVVDNAPHSDSVRSLVKERQSPVACRYVEEPRLGLALARNTGIAAAAADIIAFADDDEAPDRHWLAEVAAGFALGENVGCVTGPVLPGCLETPAQELFEQIGGHVKGRGFAADVFSRRGHQNPIYPLPPFGAGGNMAFRRKALAEIGNFDVALGAGTPAMSAEDTLAFTLILLAGYSIAYQHSALMWHTHRRDIDDLRSQLSGYSVGLTAYYAALLRHRPSVFPAMLRLAPVAARHVRRMKADGPSGLPGAFASIGLSPMRKTFIGPLAYLRGIRRKVTTDAAPPGPPELELPW